jgi:hypothetical protein
MKPFQAKYFLKNRHIQTLYSSFFREDLNLDMETEVFELSDGDFVDCYWYNRDKEDSKKPIIVLFHGLEGSYKSPYIQGVMQEAKKENFTSVIMHFRGCSPKENRLPRAYHSGSTEDAHEWLDSISKRYPESKIFCAGYSIGGNMLLKLLSERDEKRDIVASVATSVPYQLDLPANVMKQGFSQLYQYHLIKSLKKHLLKKFDKHNMSEYIELKKDDVKNIKTFWEFDAQYTAPMHGFSSAYDYYTKCSSKQFLKNIKTPTLLIHAKDDPFMVPEVIPTQEELSSSLTLELSDNGGHVGFIGGTLLKPNYWLEKRVVSYFKEFI